MPESNLLIDEKTLERGVTLLELNGTVDGQAFEHLDTLMRELIERGTLKIIVDLRQVKYLSSAGIGVFMNAMVEVRRKQGALVLFNPSENVLDVFENLHLTNLFNIADSLEKALPFFELPAKPAASA